MITSLFAAITRDEVELKSSNEEGSEEKRDAKSERREKQFHSVLQRTCIAQVRHATTAPEINHPDK